MDATIVIKAKYGKTLRRFNAPIDEAGNLGLSLNDLLKKVLSMFSLSPDADITLTYLDEDGDSVTLADDEDLNDVMRQFLNPLRITVKVNSENASISSNARSSGNSTPMGSSSRLSQTFPDFSNTVSEIFKAVPEPLGEALAKLSHDLASKATVSSPQLPELVHQFSKMLQSCMIPVSDSQVGKVPATQSADAERSTPPLGKVPATQSAHAESSTPSPLAKEPEASGGDSAKPKVTAEPNSVNQPLDSVSGPLRMNTFVAPEFSSLNVNADHHGNCEEVVKKSGESSSNAEGNYWGKPDWGSIKAVASSVIGADDEDVVKLHEESNPPGIGQCPLYWTPLENEPVVPNSHFSPRVHPFKRSFSHGGVAGIFHRGVQCDGCGVNPISGPRFKSKVRENYDLCGFCFGEKGSEADYIRMDRPVHKHPHPFERLNARVNPPTLPHVLQGVVKPNQPKLDSRFIMDVNVIDGTMMAPSTHFTKIWRMRNNGTLVWPQGTQVVWIGGDRLSASLSAGLQIPGEGLAVENELEIAVDFKAPELPGRYISYWRMASPSGQKFGQRIWVLIQVDASVKDSAPNDNWPVFNLNLPPESSGLNEAESELNNVVPIVVDGRLPIDEASNKATDLVNPLVVPLPTNNQDHDFPINDNLLVNGTMDPIRKGPPTVSYPSVGSIAASPQPLPIMWGRPPTGSYPTDRTSVAPQPLPFMWGRPQTGSYPTVGSSAAPQPPPFMWGGHPPTVSYPTVDSSAVASPQASDEEDNVEHILLKELAEMGFKQVDLNKEILRKNEYDLEQSVEALCGVSEWDPILEELQEMGFCDKELNKKLLEKNNGSIKDVVMDLIGGEKA